MKKFFTLLLLVVALGGFSLGCAGDDADTTTETETETTETEGEEEEEEEEEETPAE